MGRQTWTWQTETHSQTLQTNKQCQWMIINSSFNSINSNSMYCNHYKSSHQSRHRVSWDMCSRGPPAKARQGRGRRICGWSARRSSPRTCSGAPSLEHTLRRLRKLMVVGIFNTEASKGEAMLIWIQNDRSVSTMLSKLNSNIPWFSYSTIAHWHNQWHVNSQHGNE